MDGSLAHPTAHRPCPPLCPPDCTSHACWCPKRRDDGLVEVEVKSKAGRRRIALPGQLFTLIAKHRKVQEHQRGHAGTEWHEGGWMFRPAARQAVAGEHIPRQRHRVAGIADLGRCVAPVSNPIPRPLPVAARSAAGSRSCGMRALTTVLAGASPEARVVGRPRSASAHQALRAGGMGFLCRRAWRRPAARWAVRPLDERRPRDGVTVAVPGQAWHRHFLIRCRLRR
jgi:hypothetical protein